MEESQFLAHIESSNAVDMLFWNWYILSPVSSALQERFLVSAVLHSGETDKFSCVNSWILWEATKLGRIPATARSLVIPRTILNGFAQGFRSDYRKHRGANHPNLGMNWITLS